MYNYSINKQEATIMLSEKCLDEIKELLESDDDLLNEVVVNYLEENNWTNDIWIDMDNFDEYMSGLSPIEIAQRVFYGDFYPNHNYFKFNGYDNVVSSDYLDYKDYLDDVLNYISREEYSDNMEIQEIIDKYEDIEDEEGDIEMNKIERLKNWLVENGYKGMKTFNTRNIVGDEMETIYSEDGIFVDICYYWNYLEIFGLTKEEYQELSDILYI